MNILRILFTLIFILSANYSSHQINTDRISYEYAVYLMPGKDNVNLNKLKKLHKKYLSDFEMVSEFDTSSRQPQINISLIDTETSNYLPPSLESLYSFGRGITKEEAVSLQKNRKAVIFDVSYPRSYMHSGLYDVSLFIEEVAKSYGGLIWDEESREVFSLKKWKEQRVESFSESKIPSVMDQITIHAYKNGEFIRGITLGMKKFGKPDIVVNDFSWSVNKSVGSLINLIAQKMVEENSEEVNMKPYLDIEKIRHPLVKTSFLSVCYDNAKKSTNASLKASKAEAGDPHNILLEVDFSQIEGTNLQQKQESLLTALFGSEDSISYIEHNDEILQKSMEAKAKLPQLKRGFNKGFDPGEYLMVKAPFETPDGSNEWMWVEVIVWKDTQIEGMLRNEPYNVPTLKAGMRVKVNEIDVFDYIHYLPDGSSIGNETGKLIRKYTK